MEERQDENKGLHSSTQNKVGSAEDPFNKLLQPSNTVLHHFFLYFIRRENISFIIQASAKHLVNNKPASVMVPSAFCRTGTSGFMPLQPESCDTNSSVSWCQPVVTTNRTHSDHDQELQSYFNMRRHASMYHQPWPWRCPGRRWVWAGFWVKKVM